MTFGEFIQNYEGTHNNMILKTIDGEVLGSNGNLQGGIRYLSLDMGRALKIQWKETHTCKIPIIVMSRVN